MRRLSMRPRSRGQALVEFALVFPIALLVILAIIVIGLFVFYQQELTNVAREAARFASIHSSTSACPTASWKDPQAPGWNYPKYPYHCDGPNNPNDAYPWPKMTNHARASAWGLDSSKVRVNACWSGYRPSGAPAPYPQADFPPVDPVSGTANTFVQCSIDGQDPTTQAGNLDCRNRMTGSGDDAASDLPGNQVTVYACFIWTPPMAGLFAMPNQITIRAVLTETIQRQQ
jgi:hypothetical protein